MLKDWGKIAPVGCGRHVYLEIRPANGGYSGRVARAQRTVPLSALFLVSMFSAVMAMLLLTLLRTDLKGLPQVIGHTLSDYKVSYFGSGRDDFLARLSREKEQDLAGQMQYVYNLIRREALPEEDARRLAYSIVSESHKANYDPLLVTAIIKSESTFRRHARSEVGALGLMQIMPSTGRYMSERQNSKWLGTIGLRDPQYNIQLGIAYLKHLEQLFDGNRELALIAYNWGPANVQEALGDRRGFPFSTKTYARTIIGNHRRWEEQFSMKRDQYRYANMRVFQG